MLTKDLLRVSRAGGGYHLQFTERAHRPLAAQVLGAYQGHVGDSRGTLDETLKTIEREAADFKLVRGFAKLLDREATFETRAPIDPESARAATFEAAESVGVVTVTERKRALSEAATALEITPDTLANALYADLDNRAILVAFDSRWTPDDLRAQYDLSLAQTALFDATEIRVRSSDPKALVSAVKRLRLMYEIRKLDEPSGAESPATNSALPEREVIVTGPDTLFRATRRYGARFARLLRTVATANAWTLRATIDDRGTDRRLELTDEDVHVPGTEPVTEVSYDSGVEAEFATRFDSLGLDWRLVREPEPLESGSRVMIPDFAFEWVHGRPDVANRPGVAERPDVADADPGAGTSESAHPFRVYFEIMGFWTPEYVAKKLAQLDQLEAVEMVVAVDESLGVGEEIEARDARAITYSGSVRLKDVVRVLRRYEDDLIAASAAQLPETLAPDADVITITALAADHGVSEATIESKRFPDHDRVGRTLIRPAVLDGLSRTIEPGMALVDAEFEFEAHGITDASAVLSALGYRVEWEGLGGGTIVAK